MAKDGWKIKRLAPSKLWTMSSNFARVRPSILILIFLLHGCGDNPLPSPQKRLPAEELTAYLATKITDEDVQAVDNSFAVFCKRYPDLDNREKVLALASFYTSIATAESDRNSFKTYYEDTLGFDSVGLFSLSYKDDQTYGCDFNRDGDKDLPLEEKSIFQTEAQVLCTLKIHLKLVTRAEEFPYLRKLAKESKTAKGKAANLTVRQKLSAYWSVLRNGDGYARFKKAAQTYMPANCS